MSIQPMETKQENRIESFNEICIYACSQLYNVFLRGEGSVGFISVIGWKFMVVSAFNILVNLVVVIYQTYYESMLNCRRRVNSWEVELEY